MPQVSEQVEFRNPNLNVIPKDVLLSCKVVQTRKEEIEQKTAQLIADSFEGDPSSVGEKVTQLSPKKKTELELMAKVIVSKALDEPQYCNACVSLSGALQVLLPSLASASPQSKAESFMHALLDIFQTEFENLFMSPERTLSEEEKLVSSLCGPAELRLNQERIQAIVQFAGNLYCHGLLGNMVVSQMVQDLVDNGAEESANELLWYIGAVTGNTNPNLGTVLEDSCDSDGASSESMTPSGYCPASAHVS
jgi:hypothetical protein|eukprot:CAMPEP_0169105128 /NCGR_PEP_ID=MMETSP1015-20121227/23625_1 /TAXON_ID=342587 /ORGANISM="Karlodinium micrum, Strain CCMP2283" /LENGTH=249 /DNA_ID=CAMNT_0009166455 /DNA_START=147 /DNA_END=896 /DNA_ORIENTATION=+